MDEVGVGLFGYGFIAGAHVDALRRAGARIVAVCGPHRERAQAFARHHAIAHVYTAPARLLARADLAAVVVASPDASHAALTLAAARAGKHIFCEKPLATSLDEERAMVAAVQERGLVGMTGFLLRGAPVVQRMAATIRQGEAGALISLHMPRFNAPLLRPEAAHTWRTAAQQSGRGVLGDLGSHRIDLAVLLGGPISAVSADLLPVVRELPDAATGRPVPQRLAAATLALRLASGAHGTISLSRVGLAEAHRPLGRSQSQIVVNGRALAIISDGRAPATVHRLGRAPQERPLDARVARLDHGALLAYLGAAGMRAFLAAIRSGVPAPRWKMAGRCRPCWRRRDGRRPRAAGSGRRERLALRLRRPAGRRMIGVCVLRRDSVAENGLEVRPRPRPLRFVLRLRGRASPSAPNWSRSGPCAA